jgi:hypothetical protein
LAGPVRSNTIREPPGMTGYSEGLDQPAPGGASSGLELKADLGNIHDHPIGIGQRESAKLDRAVEVENEAGLLGIAGQPDLGGDGKVRRRDRIRRFTLGRAANAGAQTQQCCGAQ